MNVFFIFKDKNDNKQHNYKLCRIFLIFFLIYMISSYRIFNGGFLNE